VDHVLVHEKVEARITAVTIEIFHNGQRHTSHARNYVRGHFTTKPEHMPKSHKENAQWSPSRIIDWAKSVGPKTEALAQAILAERRHPEHGYRSCLGIFRLEKKYGHDRLEAACERAFAIGARSYRSVASILKKGLDSLPLETAPVKTALIEHENIRGRTYYQ
jgi:transposase